MTPVENRPVPIVLVVALAATLVVQAQQGAPVPIPRGPNVLVGRVVDVGGDTPVGGAIVTIVGFFDETGKPSPSLPEFQGRTLAEGRNVMTTGDGYFVFRDLPAGRFSLTVRALGYVNSDYPMKAIEIADGAKPPMATLRLRRHAAIGGRVVDERGEPVVGMRVEALTRAVSSSGVTWSPSAVGMTDDRGVYRIAQLAPGDYMVGVLSTTTTLPATVAGAMDPSPDNRDAYSAMSSTLTQAGLFRTWGCPTCWGSSSDGYRIGDFVLQRLGPTLPLGSDGRPLTFSNALYPGTSNPAEGTVITLGSGETRTGLDIPVRFVSGVSISGVVTGPEGPAQHHVVRLTPPGVNLNAFDPPGVATAVTDARGAFRIFAVTPGEYVLSSALVRMASETTGEGRSLSAKQQIAVGDSDITGLTLLLQPGVKMSGRVEFTNLSGNRPTGRHLVTPQPIRADTWRTIQAVVQPDGTFRTGGDPPGRYILNVTSPPGWFWQTITLNGRPVLDDIVELGASELTGLVLTFGQKTNGVSGTVTDASGAPDADAFVIVFPADSAVWRESIFSITRRYRSANSTSTGTFELTTFAPGEYFVAAVSARVARSWPDAKFLERLIPGATRVTLGPEDSKSIALKTLAVAGR